MQAAFTPRELIIALQIVEGKASLLDLKPEQRKIVEAVIQINKG